MALYKDKSHKFTKLNPELCKQIFSYFETFLFH